MLGRIVARDLAPRRAEVRGEVLGDPQPHAQSPRPRSGAGKAEPRVRGHHAETRTGPESVAELGVETVGSGTETSTS